MSYSNLIDTSRWIDLVWRHLGEEFSNRVDCGEDKVEALVVSKRCGVAGSGIAEDANGKIQVAPIATADRDRPRKAFNRPRILRGRRNSSRMSLLAVECHKDLVITRMGSFTEISSYKKPS